MAVVSPVPATTQRMGSVRLLSDAGGEILEEPNPRVVDQPIYVAVTKEVKESKLNLIWAIQTSGGKRICILYVHVRATMNPLCMYIYYASLCVFVLFHTLNCFILYHEIFHQLN